MPSHFRFTADEAEWLLAWLHQQPASERHPTKTLWDKSRTTGAPFERRTLTYQEFRWCLHRLADNSARLESGKRGARGFRLTLSERARRDGVAVTSGVLIYRPDGTRGINLDWHGP